MGLDIYLKSRYQREADRLYDEAWGSWRTGDPDPVVPPSPDEPGEIPSKSTLHPGNINEPRYLRSSYNSGGFNSAVPRFLKDPHTTYYSIFEPLIGDDHEPYLVHVTAEELVRDVQERARDVARRLRALEAPLTTIRANALTTFDGDVEAITWVETQLAKAAGSGGPFGSSAYSCREGYVDPKGTTVVAVVQARPVYGSTPDTLLVVRAVSNDGTPWSSSYADSAEVLAEEFCEEMLRLIRRDGERWIAWSG